jgi:hypothetical protein
MELRRKRGTVLPMTEHGKHQERENHLAILYAHKITSLSIFVCFVFPFC